MLGGTSISYNTRPPVYHPAMCRKTLFSINTPPLITGCPCGKSSSSYTALNWWYSLLKMRCTKLSYIARIHAALPWQPPQTPAISPVQHRIAVFYEISIILNTYPVALTMWWPTLANWNQTTTQFFCLLFQGLFICQNCCIICKRTSPVGQKQLGHYTFPTFRMEFAFIRWLRLQGLMSQRPVSVKKPELTTIFMIPRSRW